MFTVRNRKAAIAISARAGVAGLIPGQAVKLAQGTSAGDNPTAVLPTTLDYSGGTVQLFLVDWYGNDSQVTDYTVDFVNNNVPLIATAVTIPVNEQVTLYMGTLVVAYTADVLPTTLKALRESNAMGFDFATHMPSIVTDAERVNGFVLRQELPAEYTFVVKF